MTAVVRIGWTGHRPDVFRDPDQARRTVQEMARVLCDRSGSLAFICGGQRGVDLWSASAACELGIPYSVVLPVPPSSFTADWLHEERAALHDLMHQATSVDVVDPKSALGPLAYDRRNEIVAARSDRLVAVWTGLRHGGTFYTICAARDRGIAVDSIVLPPAGESRLWGRGV